MMYVYIVYYGDFKTKTLNCIFPVKNACQLKSLNLNSFNYREEYSVPDHHANTPLPVYSSCTFWVSDYRIKASKNKYKHLCKQLEASRKLLGFFPF